MDGAPPTANGQGLQVAQSNALLHVQAPPDLHSLELALEEVLVELQEQGPQVWREVQQLPGLVHHRQGQGVHAAGLPEATMCN